MLITDRFVYIHAPKTGGTFVRRMVIELYGKVIQSSIAAVAQAIPEPGTRFCIRTNTKHVSRGRVPELLAALPVLGSYRNPFERYVSQYRFGTWRSEPRKYPGIEDCPGYPDISFADYVRTANRELWLVPDRLRKLDKGLGWQTLLFLHYFGKAGTLDRLRHLRRISSADIIACVMPLTLLRTDRLNADLFRYLVRLGYDADEVRFILQAPRITPARRQSVSSDAATVPPSGAEQNPDQQVETPTEKLDWRGYFDDDLKRYVLERESVLTEMFPHWRL